MAKKMKDKSKRKQYLIDRKFQLKYTFTILGLIFVIVTIIVGIIGIKTAYNNQDLAKMNSMNEDMTQNLNNITIIQDNIVETIMTWAQTPGEKPEKKAIKQVWEKHAQNKKTMTGNIKNIQDNIQTINNLIKYNHILLLSIIIIVLVQGIIFYFLLIRNTHKISGPIYVMSRYIRDITEGKLPETRPIRKGDYLQEFYSQFTKMVKALKDKDSKK